MTVLGLARGGVAVARPVAERLELPMDVLVVRKLGVPAAPEVAFGAVGSGGVEVRDDRLIGTIGRIVANRVAERAKAEVARREAVYRGERAPLDLAGREALLIDDGLATGATARVAVGVARSLGAKRVTVAAPVGAAEAVSEVGSVADGMVCPNTPTFFLSVSQWYESFDQVSDDDVVSLLDGHVDEA